MLKVNNLNLVLSGISILKNISFNLEEGKILHLEGNNGSGKSSLLRCIMGIYQQFDGEIIIDNHKVGINTIKEYAPLMSFFIDTDFCYPYLSVKDNLKIFRYYSNVLSNSPELMALIEGFGLLNVNDEKVHKISAGYKQKLEIIISLLNEGSYVLLDEPTVNLDKASIDKLYQYIINTAKNKGTSYIIVSHNDPAVQIMSNQTISL